MTEPNITTRFARDRPRYESFRSRLDDLLRDLLDQSDIDFIQVESRVKSDKSFHDKVRRKKYSNPLTQMTDIVGVRVITYYAEDVDLVEDLIRREFLIDERNSVNKSDQLDPDRFGYRSKHFVATLKEPRSQLGEWQNYHDLAIEFQVRTALQHAWAAVQHKLDYKRPQEIPTGLRRGLYRLSALFEIADEQFSAYRRQAGDLEASYRDLIGASEETLPIDRESIRALVEDSEMRQTLDDIADHAGLQTWDNEGMITADISSIVRFAEVLGIDSIDSLVRPLELQSDLGRQINQTYYAEFSQRTSEAPDGSIADVIATAMCVKYLALDSAMADLYREEALDAIRATRAAHPGYVLRVT